MAGIKKQNFLHGAAILTISTVILKILGFIYKIPLYNLLGDEGTAHFNVAYNIYNVLLTLSTAGLPVALSRLISESDALGKTAQVKRTFRIGLAAFVVLGAVGSLAMFLFPTELAAMMHEVEASQSIWALSPAVFLVCLLSAYRGWAQGLSDMVPTSVSQVIEVAVKVVAGLLLAWVFLRGGKSLPEISAAAIFGVPIGTLVACVYIIVHKHRAEKTYQSAVLPEGKTERSSVILGNLLKIGVPIALGASVLSVITLIDTMLTLNRLQVAAGFSYDEAKTLFGVYSKALTLFNFPAAFILPVTISVVPAIASSLALKRYKEALTITESSMRVSTIVALPMGIGLTVLAYPIMNVLYPNSSEEGAGLLAVMGIASYFVCMALVTTAILQANGNERLPIYSMILGGVVKIIVSWLLVSNPEINIHGAPVGTLSCYIVMCAMNYGLMCSRLTERPRISRVVLRPALSAAAMGGASWAAYGLSTRVLDITSGRLNLTICLISGVGAGVIVYLAMIVLTRAVTLEDMKLIPKGERIAKILRIR